MILDLREFESFPARKKIVADPEGFSVDYDSICSLERLTIDLEIQAAGEEYYCRGKMSAEAHLECARCLQSFPASLQGELDFFCRPEGWTPPGGEGVVDDEDYAWFGGSDLRADIGELVRQAVVLAVDLKPLCSEDCQGLCSTCGKNLNEVECDCKKDTIDRRWRALEDVKKKLT